MGDLNPNSTYFRDSNPKLFYWIRYSKNFLFFRTKVISLSTKKWNPRDGALPRVFFSHGNFKQSCILVPFTPRSLSTCHHIPENELLGYNITTIFGWFILSGHVAQWDLIAFQHKQKICLAGLSSYRMTRWVAGVSIMHYIFAIMYVEWSIFWIGSLIQDIFFFITESLCITKDKK